MTDHNEVPEAAVEAAAKAVDPKAFEERKVAWRIAQDQARQFARKALAAALPYLAPQPPTEPTRAEDAPHVEPGGERESPWLGPYKTAADALDGLRRAVATEIGADPDTWPDHGNAPLAIAATVALARACFSRDAVLEEAINELLEASRKALIVTGPAMKAANEFVWKRLSEARVALLAALKASQS